jgi:GntR family transcriptional regulator, transcriptional repressor for pyruvate dehydrogenase complex
VTTRRGRYGGRFVTGEPDGGNGRDVLLARVRADASRIEQALAFRAAVDGLAARLAAERSGGDGIAAAAEAVAVAPDDAAFMAADTAFHLELARAGANAFVLAAVEDVRLALNDAFAALPESRRWHERSLAEHAALVAAVDAGDGAAAEAAARTHAASTERGVRALLRALG